MSPILDTLASSGCWEFKAHLHNHPFDFTNLYGDFGGNLVPSPPDVQSYLYFSPELALVTNGIDTIEIPRPQFQSFQR